MESKLLAVFYFPEFLLTSGCLILLLIAIFLKQNVFKTISFLSIILLLVVGISVLKDATLSFAFYNTLFKSSQFILFFKILIIIGSIVSIAISVNFFDDLKLKRFEIPILILFSTLGMMVLIASNNLMSMYLGIELQSLSLYVIAAINRDSLQSSESGVKYFVLGALSSGILLYGCSLIYGFAGTTNFTNLAVVSKNLASFDTNLGLIVGLVFLISGLAFKVSAVPFHMWTPDVYEGAPTPVTAFFAVAPKIAAVALLVRVLIGPFGFLIGEWQQILIFISAASMCLGALAAIWQDNIKRLLAYSSIGHVGYALIGLTTGTESGVQGILIYLAIYLVMNVGTFCCVLSMRQAGRMVEGIKDLSGLSRNQPLTALALTLMMFSMAGIPPLAGFFGKFYIFLAAINSGLYALAVIGVLTSVVGAFYYIRIIKIMYVDDPGEVFDRKVGNEIKVILMVTTLFVTLFILGPDTLINSAGSAAQALFIS